MTDANDVAQIEFDDQSDKISTKLIPAKGRRVAALSVTAIVGRNDVKAVEMRYHSVPAAGMKDRCMGQEY